MSIRRLVFEGIALFGAVDLGRGAGFINFPSELCALCLGGLSQRDSCRFGVAVEVGALLFGIAGQITPLLLGLAGELGASELGLAGKRRRGIPGLAHLAVGNGLELCSFALGLGTHGGGLALGGGTRFGGFGGNRATDRCRVPQRLLGDGFGLGPRALEKLGRLGVRRVEDATDSGMRIGHALVGTVRRVSTQLRDLGLHSAPQLLGIDVGLADEPGRLFLGDPEGVLELRAEPAIGRAAGLFDLRLQVIDCRVKPLELFGGLGLVAVCLDQLTPKVLDRTVNLVAIVSAHCSGEGFVVSGHAVSS